MKQAGSATLLFENRPYVLSAASVAGKAEEKGPYGHAFDEILEDDRLGEKTFERGERKMLLKALHRAMTRVGLPMEEAGCLLAGDLLNQIVTASYAARELKIPYLGLYGACSTMTEALLLGAALVDGGYRDRALCAACSHFSTAERQYRFPLEMGTTAPPHSQRTVTGAGAVLLGAAPLPHTGFRRIRLEAATIGAVRDLGITDANNMGAAMAPAAYDTIGRHLSDRGMSELDFDWIVTGDLGDFGSRMLRELAAEGQMDLEDRHLDCGSMIFSPEQNYHAGGSGCGCSAVMLTGHVLPELEKGAVKRVLFLSTGALMSPLSACQGESIPGIAHAVSLVYEE
ncbi:MAG: stage V sporulation protein AD [Clostridia bacterium]|nr:stage V sporulation protein AD [Clostridia bacterium]